MRMAHAYKTIFSDVVALQNYSLEEVQDVVQSVIQSVQRMHGGFEEVSCCSPH
jgi:hypothetical protein